MCLDCFGRLTQELMGQLASRKETLADNTLSTAQFGELLDLVAGRTITGLSFSFPILVDLPFFLFAD